MKTKVEEKKSKTRNRKKITLDICLELWNERRESLSSLEEVLGRRGYFISFEFGVLCCVLLSCRRSNNEEKEQVTIGSEIWKKKEIKKYK